MKKSTIVNSRLPYLDYARLFAAFLVILGHLYTKSSNDPLRIFIYHFHMPFFFMASGMLHHYRGSIQIHKYFNQLIKPALLFIALYVIIIGGVLHIGIVDDKLGIVTNNLLLTYCHYFKYAIVKIMLGNAGVNATSWFLFSLFYIKCFVDYSEKNKWVSLFIWIVLFFLLCFLHKRYFYVAASVMSAPFYYLGYKFKESIEHICEKFKLYIPVIATTFILFSVLYIREDPSTLGVCFGSHTRLFSIPMYYINGILGSMMIFSLCLLLPQKNNDYISNAAQSLITILLTQLFFTFVIQHTIGLNNSYLLSIVIAMIIFVICSYLHKIIMKLIPWVYR